MHNFTTEQLEILNNVGIIRSQLGIHYHKETLNHNTDNLNYLDEIGYIYWNNFEERYYLTQHGKDYVRSLVSA